MEPKKHRLLEHLKNTGAIFNQTDTAGMLTSRVRHQHRRVLMAGEMSSASTISTWTRACLHLISLCSLVDKGLKKYDPSYGNVDYKPAKC
ncbi:hypothetical protein RRG08_038846 [Elysia crispata]|uniref:Uncharacterized protein n=1 Tax=Elysia crispata TaxID=231223 RepID=A0AAE0YUA4_9GAST|nr:hypothetical protein RRG08_038846 [Elysia crispata]